MEFTHYRWTEGDDGVSIFTGEPSRRVFDPFNGNQVLFLINYCLSIVGRYSVVEARAIENRIAYKLPMNSRSERSGFNWLTGEVGSHQWKMPKVLEG